jgi:hypothetical protein
MPSLYESDQYGPYLKKYSLRFYPGIIHEDELFSAMMYLWQSELRVSLSDFIIGD